MPKLKHQSNPNEKPGKNNTRNHCREMPKKNIEDCELMEGCAFFFFLHWFGLRLI